MTSTIPERTQPDWARVSSQLTRFAQSLCSSRDEAEELSQQTIARLLARRPDKADHLGLARTTLTRLWLDRQRSLRRRLARLRLIAAHRVRPPDVAQGLTENESIARASAALQRLPARQRAALVLRLIEDLDYATIAGILECDVGAVRSNLHLARRALRLSLGEEP